MLEAAFWGFVGGGALIVGALAGLFLPVGRRTIGVVMAGWTAPESVAIGVGLLGGAGVGAATVAAVSLGNVPESMSAATGLRTAGHGTRWIIGLWCAVAAVSAAAAALGYAVLGDASPDVVAAIQAFAAGAILVMLADTMVPEAFEHGGDVVGLATLPGFAPSFVPSTA